MIKEKCNYEYVMDYTIKKWQKSDLIEIKYSSWECTKLAVRTKMSSAVMPFVASAANARNYYQKLNRKKEERNIKRIKTDRDR